MKSVGAVICFFACTFWGFAIGQAQKQRTAECEAFLSVFTYIQNQIAYFFAPTKMIYDSLQNEVLQKTGFPDALKSHKNDDVYFDVWGAALDSCRDRLHLTENQLDIVRGFGGCIGKSNEDLQLKNLEYYRAMMAEEVAKQKEEMKKNIKIARTLGMAAGILVMILFL